MAHMGGDVDGEALAYVLALQHQTKAEQRIALEAPIANATSQPLAATSALPLSLEQLDRAHEALHLRVAVLLRTCLALSVRVMLLEEAMGWGSSPVSPEPPPSKSDNLGAALVASAHAAAAGMRCNMPTHKTAAQGLDMMTPSLSPGTTSEATRSMMPLVLQLPPGVRLAHPALSKAYASGPTTAALMDLADDSSCMEKEASVLAVPAKPPTTGALPHSFAAASSTFSPSGPIGLNSLDVQVTDDRVADGVHRLTWTCVGDKTFLSAAAAPSFAADDEPRRLNVDQLLDESLLRRIVLRRDSDPRAGADPNELSEAIEGLVRTLRVAPLEDGEARPLPPRTCAQRITKMLSAMSAEVWPRWVCMLDLALLHPDALVAQLGPVYVRELARRCAAATCVDRTCFFSA